MNFDIKKNIEMLLKEQNNTNVCISLDWLGLYFNQKDFFEKEYKEGTQIILSENLYLLALNKPTLHFNTHFLIIHRKEECGHLLCNSRNEKMFKKEIVKVEFANHTLYSGEWIEIYNALDKILVYKAASRIDVCIDGVGYLYKLMNLYAKQSPKERTMLLKNSSESRGRFSAKVLNPKNMMFQNFNIGSSGGNKMVTIYNKSLELVRSGKQYIQDYWLKNGVIKQEELMNLQEQAKKIKKNDITLNTKKTIYRFELRLKSESIKEIQGFTVDMLKTAEGLAGIVKLHIKKYFEAAYYDNNNVSLCTTFDLLPLDRLGANPLTKVERQENDGRYIAKLTIHGLIKDIHKDYLQRNNVNESIEIIFDRVCKYRLGEYLDRKLWEWHKKYKPMIDPDRFNDVLIILHEIENQNQLYITTDPDLGSRNDQPDSTAGFGDE